MQKILVSGGTGFVGSALVRALLSQGHDVSVLSRDVGRARSLFGGKAQLLEWAPPLRWPSAMELGRHDAIVHLAGERAILKRYDERSRRRIRDSRVLATRRLVELMAEANPRPRTFLCASAVGYYGAQSAELPLDESAPEGEGFLAELCHEWETAAKQAESLGVRVVSARLGVVLGSGGGALQAMLGTFRAGLGGRIGSGKQVMSWIHLLEDAVRALGWTLEHETVRGPVNVVGPQPVDNGEFTKALGQALGRPTLLPVPAFALRALLGEGAEPLLTGQCVVPQLLKEEGFVWNYPVISQALAEALRK